MKKMKIWKVRRKKLKKKITKRLLCGNKPTL